MKLKILICCLALLVSYGARCAGFLEREIFFSEAEIQTRLDKNGPLEKRYGGLLKLTLPESPKIRLGQPEGRAGIVTHMKLKLSDQAEIPVDVTGSSGIRYDNESKAFFLENPVADSVRSAALPADMEPLIRQAVTQLMSNYFRAKPVYVLRAEGSAEERAARWLLRSIRIEPGRVVAILSPI